MNKIFLDIETIPAHENNHELLREIHRKNTEKNSRIEKDFKKYLAQTSFDGGFGQIVCICYSINDEAIETLTGNETEILQKFWKVAKDIDLFIGFNIMEFDLRFIYQRSIVLKVKPTKVLNFARYRNDPIYDIMHEWKRWNMTTSISLDTLAKILGLPTSKDGGIEGKDVAQAYKDGRIEEICEYCERDVELTRKIYKRMMFE
ncbi:MAG: ribonuclease H-like domain-containing protein [Candidatus Daviesbacteria bacterium]|nr:ribonuclease H-like domain-containing protein [Candidatus Daviesbacteria bacterium]